MERIHIGVYFANEDVKEKFLEASKCGLGKINSYNENGFNRLSITKVSL